MRLHLAVLLSVSSVLLPVSAFAAPAMLQPPVTGSMYNGNNVRAPSLEAADKADYNPTDATNQSARSPTTGGQAGAGNAKPQASGGAGGNASSSNGAGGNTSGLRDTSGGQPAAATGATLGTGSAGAASRAGGGN